MKIAIILTHNKSDKENFDQIEAIKLLINKIDVSSHSFDHDGKITDSFQTYHYELYEIPLQHQVKFYQIVPFGINIPENFNDIDSHNVIYRKGDEDKVGKHPRFFNWGLKRGTDYGADIVIHLNEYKNISLKKILPKLERVFEMSDNTEFIDDPAYKISSIKLLNKVGQVDESKDLNNTMIEFKKKITKKGLRHG